MLQAENFSNLLCCLSTELAQMDTILNELSVEFSFESLMLSDASSVGKESESVVSEIRKKMSQSPSIEMKNLLADKRKLLESCTL